MSQMAKFAYSQARLHARHGDRLDAAGWRRLSGVGDLLQLLQAARASALRPWVLPFSEETDMHTMELWLRRQFREYVDTVAGWQPASWRDATRWTRRLLDLPALRHLLSGELAWPWMREDEALELFVTEDGQARVQAMRDSDCAPLVQAFEADLSLLEGWLGQWRKLWPTRTLSAPLESLRVLLRRHLEVLTATTDVREAEREREQLKHQLVAGFRRHVHDPAGAYFHLALVAADIAALRGELVRHRLFDVTRQDVK
ncbi:MAG: hypothetical protein OEN48_09750 [Betaproteobacteria bacterium]|nr:hypothetical protein [Gammaproteobacteria bacterium]MDH3437256.1 hypothetical protein [Betaproteobacteria bacterium]